MRAGHYVKPIKNEVEYNAALATYEALRIQSIQAAEAAWSHERTAQLLSKIPLRFRHKTWADFKVMYPGQLTVKKAAERFVATFDERLSEGTCLLFQGKPGTGKTFLSLLIYRALAERGVAVSYESSLHFLKAIQEKKFESHAGFNALIDHYRQLPLLIIDEVSEGCGKEGYLAEWERSLLFAVMDARYQEQRCTIVISNRSKPDLIERLGTPIIDRLSENGVMMGFEWDSYRQHHARNQSENR